MLKFPEKYKAYPHASVYNNVLLQQFGVLNNWELYNVARSNKNFIQRLQKCSTLKGHTGCVNTISWNTSGTLLLSGSDDYLINIYDIYSEKLLHSIESGHRANIFSAKFLPCTSDMKIVSCSGDGMLHYNELGTDYGENFFNCHSGTTYEVLVTPGDPNTFLSCGEDGTVRLFDLRTKTKCACQECSEDILIDTRHAVTSISINPLSPYHLAAGCKDSYVRLFDRRTLGTSVKTRSVNRSRGVMSGLFCKFKPEKLRKDASCRITSLRYSNDGSSVLVSYCTDYVYTFSVNDKQGLYMDSNVKKSDDASHGNRAKNTNYLDNESDGLPPVKRLRLRGDWSDTGPQARPETTMEESVPENNLMQRMSELFSRWLDNAVSSPLERQNSNPSTTSVENETENETGNDEPPAHPDNKISENVDSDDNNLTVNNEATNLQDKDPGEEEVVNCPVGNSSLDEDETFFKSDNPSASKEGRHSNKTNDEIGCSSNNPCSSLNESGKWKGETQHTVIRDINSGKRKVRKSKRNVLLESTEENSEKIDYDNQLNCCNMSQNDRCSPTNDEVEGSEKHITDTCIESDDILNERTLWPDDFDCVEKKKLCLDAQCEVQSSGDPSSDHDQQTNDEARVVECTCNNYDNNKKSMKRTKVPDELDTNLSSDKRVVENEQTFSEQPIESCCFCRNNKSPVHLTEEDNHLPYRTIDVKGKYVANINGEESNLEQSETVETKNDSSYSTIIENTSNDRVAPLATSALSKINEEANLIRSNSINEDVIKDDDGNPTLSHVSNEPSPSDESSNCVMNQTCDTDDKGSAECSKPCDKPCTDNDDVPCDMDIDDTVEDAGNAENLQGSSDYSMKRERAASRIQNFLRLKKNRFNSSNFDDVDINDVHVPSKYSVFKGHRNARTMIKEANFWGEDYILSGSDCGRIFIWDRHTGELVMLLTGDSHVVNCVQPHPYDPILASSGIDHDIKIWAPLAEELPDLSGINEIVNRNEQMLEESRDTITVPASFVLRMLASFGSRRRGNSLPQVDDDAEDH